MTAATWISLGSLTVALASLGIAWRAFRGQALERARRSDLQIELTTDPVDGVKRSLALGEAVDFTYRVWNEGDVEAHVHVDVLVPTGVTYQAFHQADVVTTTDYVEVAGRHWRMLTSRQTFHGLTAAAETGGGRVLIAKPGELPLILRATSPSQPRHRPRVEEVRVLSWQPPTTPASMARERARMRELLDD